eukprot:2096400-Rhodomonas_salina.1
MGAALFFVAEALTASITLRSSAAADTAATSSSGSDLCSTAAFLADGVLLPSPIDPRNAPLLPEPGARGVEAVGVPGPGLPGPPSPVFPTPSFAARICLSFSYLARSTSSAFFPCASAMLVLETERVPKQEPFQSRLIAGPQSQSFHFHEIFKRITTVIALANCENGKTEIYRVT